MEKLRVTMSIVGFHNISRPDLLHYTHGKSFMALIFHTEILCAVSWEVGIENKFHVGFSYASSTPRLLILQNLSGGNVLSSRDPVRF